MLAFDEAAHQYCIDGVTVPSVTQLVAPLGDDFDDVDAEMELTVEAAADRGVTMHAYIAYRLGGGAMEDFELPSQYLPYADAVELFLSEHSITPMLVEASLAGDGYAGTPDLVCEFDGSLSVLDYKFVSQICKPRVGAQLEGYKSLCEFNGIYPESLFAIQFLSDGTYRLYPVDGVQSQVAWTVCKSLYEIKKQKHPRGHIG